METIAAPRARARSRAAYFMPGGLLVAAGLLLFGSTGRDDAYITYWPAETLAHSGKILNYNGARLEQSSSLLHVIVLAVVSRLTTLPMPATGWLVGVAGGIAVVTLAAFVAERIAAGAGWRAGVLVATGAYLVYWSFGGLETSIAAAAFLLALVVLDATIRRTHSLGLCVLGLLAYVLVRPEAPVVLLAIAGLAVLVAVLAGRTSLVSAQEWDVRDALRASAAVALAILVVIVFRRAYFGDFVPQPVHAKVSGLRISDGVEYVRHWLLRPDALALVGFAAYSYTRRQRSPLEALLWFGGFAQLAFVVSTGGDWMEAGRFLVAFLTVAAVLAAAGTTRIPRGNVVAGVLVATQLLGLLLVARSDSTGRPLFAAFNANPAVVAHVQVPWYEKVNRVHARDAAFEPKLLAVIDAVHHETGRAVVVASGQAGMVIHDVLRARPDVVQFIDRGRLTGDAFGRCASGLVDSPFGRAMPYDYWFTHTDQCDVPLPDVVFDLGDGHAAGLGPQYVITDVLRGPRIVAKGKLRGAVTDTTEFVAVRSDHSASQPQR